MPATTAPLEQSNKTVFHRGEYSRVIVSQHNAYIYYYIRPTIWRNTVKVCFYQLTKNTGAELPNHSR